MTYSEFLFSQLFIDYIDYNETEYKETEYDIIYPEVIKHQEQFLNSKYNRDEFSETVCILNYLNKELLSK